MEIGFNPEALWTAIPMIIFGVACLIVSRKTK